MTIERRVETFPASGKIQFAGGTLFRIVTSTAPVEARFMRDGTFEVISNVFALIVRRVRPFENVILTAAAATVIEVFYGTDIPEQDETDIPITSTTISGVTAVAEQPSTTVSDLAPSVIANGTAPSVIPASLTRRRFSLQADSANPGSCFARTSAAGNNVRELVPGVMYQFDTRDEIFVRNDTGANCTFYRFEET